jgi:hypothetical protein
LGLGEWRARARLEIWRVCFCCQWTKCKGLILLGNAFGPRSCASRFALRVEPLCVSTLRASIAIAGGPLLALRPGRYRAVFCLWWWLGMGCAGRTPFWMVFRLCRSAVSRIVGPHDFLAKIVTPTPAVRRALGRVLDTALPSDGTGGPNDGANERARPHPAPRATEQTRPRVPSTAFLH